MNAIRLRCEYLNNPIGIDLTAPRLFWNCTGGKKQSAYRITACDENGALLWDSGKVESDGMTKIPYEGKLFSGLRVIWRVKLWDENGCEGEWSQEAFFEVGLMEKSDWKASWISGDYRPDPKKRYPVDCFKKSFYLDERPVRARLYISACGLYEAHINGTRVGEFVLAPGVTDYRKRVQYQTYDVTGLLCEGENELCAELADGWYRGCVGAWGLRNQYGAQTKLISQLEMSFSNGSTRTVLSDGSWLWSNDGPIRFADNKDGELYDATIQPSYSSHARLCRHNVTPTASNNVPLCEHERLTATMTVTPSGKKLFDFGQLIAGYVEFDIEAKKGENVCLRFGEMLKDSELTLDNIQCRNSKITTPLQRVEYICKDGKNHYKTRFAIFGFRYIEADTSVDIRPEQLRAIAVYSAFERTGYFQSSNALLDKFVENTVWAAKSNSADLPTDCPTRERHGWTGDAQIFFGTAAYLFDYASFAQKYVRDMYDWQKKDGCLPQIVPYGGVDSYMCTMNGSVGWSDAGVLIPYRRWKRYNDDAQLIADYDKMAAYARFMIKRCGAQAMLSKKVHLKGEAKKYIVNKGQSYGEWAEPADVLPMHWTNVVFPHPEESTAYTCYIMEIMTEIAQHLGKGEDAELYKKYANGTKAAYQALRRLSEFSLDTDRQAQLVRPLYLRLLDEEQTEYAKKRLIKAMENYGWRLGTGFLSTPFILDVLAALDIKYAYRLLENEEMPGWLFMPKNDATSVWENWEGTQAQGGIASLNHYSKGACVEWLFSKMCGINVSGENSFYIAPQPGGSFTHASAAYNSIFGMVECAWSKRADGSYSYTIKLPANTCAKVSLPDGRELELCSGEYEL